MAANPPASPRNKPVPRPRLARLITLVFLILIIGFGSGVLGAWAYNNGRSGSSTAQVRVISDQNKLIEGIAQNVGQSVVSIDVQAQVTSPDVFGFVRQQTMESAGTGFIIGKDGMIVTNRHVIPTGADSVSVTLADGTHYDNVKIIGRTADSSPLDVGFLKITDLKGKKLTPAKLGNSLSMQVGDRVVAIGNALGQFQNTVTEGIISGYGRDVVASDQSGGSSEQLTDLFQTDAAINPGNSGGPLVNINGEVIGLNTATASGAQNIGFSIPIDDVKGLIKTVLNTGKIQQPFLGVVYISLTPDLAFQLNLPIKRGAYIPPAINGQPSVIPGSPAEKAGFKEKDIITKIGSMNIDEKLSLIGALSYYQPGDTVNITVLRGDKTMTLRATLTAAPQ